MKSIRIHQILLPVLRDPTVDSRRPSPTPLVFPDRRDSTPPGGFTLVEVLVAITIIIILAAILFPVARNIRESAKESQCAGNMRQLAVAIMGFATDNQMKLPPHSLNQGESKYSPMFELLRPYTGEGASLSRIPIWECPSQMIKSEGPSDMTFGFSGHPKLFVNARDSNHGGSVPPEDLGAWTSLSSIARPEGVFMLIDAGQRSPSGWPTAILNNLSATSTGSPANADQPMTGKPFMEPDTDLGSGAARYRHRGKANVLFVDGHVESFRKGRILQKHVYLNY